MSWLLVIGAKFDHLALHGIITRNRNFKIRSDFKILYNYSDNANLKVDWNTLTFSPNKQTENKTKTNLPMFVGNESRKWRKSIIMVWLKENWDFIKPSIKRIKKNKRITNVFFLISWSYLSRL